MTLEFDGGDEAEAFKGFLAKNVWSSSEASPALAGTPRARVLVDVSLEP